MRTLNFTINEEYNNHKVLRFLKNEAHLSSRLITSLKQVESGIQLNGQHIRTVDTMKTGDILTINIPKDKNHIEPRNGYLDIIYEDDDIIVINKSPLLAVHPTHNHQGDTLANLVAGHLEKQHKTATFRAIGRLDKGTSGLILLALNSYCASRLSQTGIQKTYLAIAGGNFIGSGTIDRPIYRPDPMKTLRAVGENGEHAVTHWESLKFDDEMSLLKIHLETGRTHQIRVHFLSLGAPLIGDRLYGGEREDITHQSLHCHTMRFTHPVTKRLLTLCAPMSDDMKRLSDCINC